MKKKHFTENGAWGSWGSYGTCSKTCGTGTKTRTRTCDNPAPIGNGAACPGSSSDDADCNTQPCPSNEYDIFFKLLIFFWFISNRLSKI